MGKQPSPILQPVAACQWNSCTVDQGFYWEFGGSVNLKNGYGPSYVVIAPDHIPITTIGLRSDECRKKFDHLFLRVGALDACYLPIEADTTNFIFVTKETGFTSKSNLSFWKGAFTHESLSQMILRMHEESPPSTVAEIKTYITAQKNRDWQALVPLKPYQQHKFNYLGLKLGGFLSDHIDADPALLDKLQKKSKCRLPDDYRSFILETNGGHLKNQVFFHAKKAGKPRRLASFTRFDANSEFSLPESHFQFDPPGFLCIARDSHDSNLYLGIDDTIHGRVYWLAPKAFEGFYKDDSLTPIERAGLDGMYLLAESFSFFIGQLKVTDDLA
jgi:hypothetical protein